MHRISLALVLFLAGCATVSPVAPPQPAPVQPIVPDRAGLVGLTAQQLVSKLGSPALQVREGTSLKLQFRNSRCVIDAYLYPSPGDSRLAKVEHVDTRAPSGIDSNEQVCVDLFQSKAN